MRTTGFIVSACLLAAGCASAGTIGFNGNFTQDDNVVLFRYSVASTGLVTVQTTSFAGGGFLPILTVFDSTGLLVYQDSGSDHTPTSDAYLEWNSLGGEDYIVSLTQYWNYPIGFELSEGFSEQGNGNFTAKPPFNIEIPGGSFLLPGADPEQRTSYWAVEFSSGVESLQASVISEVPEPSSGLLSLAGGLLIGGRIAARRRRRNP